MNKYFAHCGEIEIVSPSKIAKIITHEYVYSKINQSIAYNIFPVQTGLGFASDVNINTGYEIRTIVEFGDKESFILYSLVKELNNQIIITDGDQDYQDAIENGAAFCCQNSSSSPTHAIAFSNGVFIIGDFTDNSIAFKQATPNAGALVIYRPHAFAIVNATTMHPTRPSEYNKYVSNVSIHKTLQRLDLRGI